MAAFTPPKFGTTITDTSKGMPELEKASKKVKGSDRTRCINNGGTWDEATQTCNLPGFKPSDDPTKINLPKEDVSKADKPKAALTNPEVILDSQGKQIGIDLPDGRRFLGLNQAEIAQVAAGTMDKNRLPEGTAPAGTAQGQADIQMQGEQLAGQVGQFNELGVSPTGLDTGEALTAGIIGSIPSALRTGGLAFAGALAGAKVGAAAGTVVTPGVGTLIGAGIGLAAGLAAGMISNFKSQRTDTTTAQQRVLDEGKQTLKDWATLAKSDPGNRAFYLSQYNIQAAQINQAYRQMKLDTSKDVAKFETSLPNLAEFESFYSPGGERDALDLEMQTSLQAQAPPDYEMLELGYRRTNEKGN